LILVSLNCLLYFVGTWFPRPYVVIQHWATRRRPYSLFSAIGQGLKSGNNFRSNGFVYHPLDDPVVLDG
jgi:hypothetical protein